MSSEPSKATGQFHSVKGNVVESIGNLTGAQSWKTSGQQEHAGGEAEIQAAKAKGYAEGASDRVTGKKDNIVGAVTGDKQQQFSGNAKNEAGKKEMEFNKNY